MPFDYNFTEMDDKCQQNRVKIVEVITIDDDDEEEDNSLDESFNDNYMQKYINLVNNIDETDEIEILEIFSPKSETILPLNSSQLSDTLEVETELKTNDMIGDKSGDSCDNCLQKINNIREDLNQSLSCNSSEEVVAPINDQKSDIKSPKRIIPVTIQTQPSTSRADESLDKTTDEIPNKIRRLSCTETTQELNSAAVDESPAASSAINPMPSTSHSKPDFKTLFQNYLKAFRDRMTELNTKPKVVEEWVQKLEAVHLKVEKTDPIFLKSNQFSKLMEIFTKEISEFKTERQVLRHHNDLVLELNRLAQNRDNKEKIKIKNKNKKVKGLTKTLKELQKKIFAAENEELDYESMESKSCFTDLPKLYRKVQEVWAIREELLRRSTSTGKYMFKRYKCDSTPYPLINSCVEKLFTNYLKKIKNKSRGYVDESFTFIDVRKAILDVIKDNNLVVMNCESMIENIYKDLLNEKRYRREKDTEELFETLETLDDLKPESFIESDPLLELELAKNKKSFDERMQALFDKYATEDRNKNGDSVLKDGSSEWDSGLANSGEEFESLDVNDGELEEDNDEDNEEESDEDIGFESAPVPDFNKPENDAKPTASVPEEVIDTNDDKPSDEILS